MFKIFLVFVVVVRQIKITPEFFQYTNAREGKEPGPYNGRTFWVKGAIDFAKNIFDLRIKGGHVNINMCNLLIKKAMGQAPVVPSAPPLDVADLIT